MQRGFGIPCFESGRPVRFVILPVGDRRAGFGESRRRDHSDSIAVIEKLRKKCNNLLWLFGKSVICFTPQLGFCKISLIEDAADS
jgi:hypothetical protein